MTNIYKCIKSDFEDLTKKINRITKKLDKYNVKWEFKQLGESVEQVAVTDYRNLNNIPMSQFQPKKCNPITVEVISYSFEMENLKLGKYELLAVIDHNAITDSKENIIHVLKEGFSIPLKYRTIASYCDHCNSNRQRNKTVLLQDENGDIKQVGTTCIKEYTGIDGLDIIGNYQEIKDICLTEVYADFEKTKGYPKYDKTIDYLAACIELIKTVGYSKDENPTKYRAWEIAGSVSQTQEYFPLAEKVIEYFKSQTYNESDTFLNNIKLYVSEEYTKVNGFVAYAYIAYEKEIEKDIKKQSENENKKESNFVGNIGEKLEIELTFKKYFSFETMYGIQKIYLFEDELGNVYKWNTGNSISKSEGEHLTLKGTIKEHEEYREQKQTVLTRCKIKE